jgi:hypothetical protein
MIRSPYQLRERPVLFEAFKAVDIQNTNLCFRIDILTN